MTHPHGVVMAMTCQVHRHREMVPTERHHVWPLGLGGPNVDSNKITVCANGHYSIHGYMALLAKNGGKVPWLAKRRFGRKVRAYAESGWIQAGSPASV